MAYINNLANLLSPKKLLLNILYQRLYVMNQKNKPHMYSKIYSLVMIK